MTPPGGSSTPDLDALWSEWGIRSYGKAGRQIARELQGLVRDTVHQERVRMDASAEAAVAEIRDARRAPFDCPPGFAARHRPDLSQTSHAATVLQDGEGVAGKPAEEIPS